MSTSAALAANPSSIIPLIQHPINTLMTSSISSGDEYHDNKNNNNYVPPSLQIGSTPFNDDSSSMTTDQQYDNTIPLDDPRYQDIPDLNLYNDHRNGPAFTNISRAAAIAASSIKPLAPINDTGTTTSIHPNQPGFNNMNILKDNSVNDSINDAKLIRASDSIIIKPKDRTDDEENNNKHNNSLISSNSALDELKKTMDNAIHDENDENDNSVRKIQNESSSVSVDGSAIKNDKDTTRLERLLEMNGRKINNKQQDKQQKNKLLKGKKDEENDDISMWTWMRWVLLAISIVIALYICYRIFFVCSNSHITGNTDVGISDVNINLNSNRSSNIGIHNNEQPLGKTYNNNNKGLLKQIEEKQNIMIHPQLMSMRNNFVNSPQ